MHNTFALRLVLNITFMEMLRQLSKRFYLILLFPMSTTFKRNFLLKPLANISSFYSEIATAKIFHYFYPNVTIRAYILILYLSSVYFAFVFFFAQPVDV